MTLPDVMRRRQRMAIVGFLLAAHLALLVELMNDRVAVIHPSSDDGSGAVTLWMSMALKARGLKRDESIAKRQPERPAARRAARRMAEPSKQIADSPPVAPARPMAPEPATQTPVVVADPRLTGNFSTDEPAGSSAMAEAKSMSPGSGAAGAAQAASAPLRLNLGKDFFAAEHEREKHLTPAQEAMRDPRSNRLVLTPHEKRMIAFGEIECVAWQREPDGSFYRGPGHWRRVVPAPTGSHELQECVR